MRAPERDVDDELAYHFERAVAELRAAGWTREAAEAEARRRFGDEALYRRRLQRLARGTQARQRRRQWALVLAHALRAAARSLRRTPGLSFSVILAFALGIGANATMFGVIDRLLLSPPRHIASPQQVRRVYFEHYEAVLHRRSVDGTAPLPGYEDLLGNSQFAGIAAYSSERLTVGRGTEARRVRALQVTGNYWQVLGVRPALGRFFTEAEDQPGAPATVVLSWELWQSMFGGQRDVLGRDLEFGYGPWTIVGVAPRGFTGVDLSAVSFWLPARRFGSVTHTADLLQDRGYYWLDIVARMAPGASVAAAEAEATRAHRRGRADAIARGRYDPDARVITYPLNAAAGSRLPAEVNVALWLGGVSLLVLLIACVNVANLLLARGIRTQRQLGISLVLGNTRGRIAVTALAEGLMLALLGGVAALAVARWGGAIVRSTLFPGTLWPDDGVSARTILLSLALSLAAALAACALPLFTAMRQNVADTLRVQQGGITRSTARLRAALTVLQATLSVVLLVGAGLFVRSLRHVRALDLGFDARSLLIAIPDADGSGVDSASLARFFERATSEVPRLPGVRAVAAAAELPFGNSSSAHLFVPGRDSLPRLPAGGPYVNVVTAGYIDALDLRVLQGRGFAASDGPGSEPVVVVNQTMAKLAWPDGSAVGQCLMVQHRGAPCARVVGVVGDANRTGLQEPPAPQYYVLLDQHVFAEPAYALVVRTAGEAAKRIADVRSALVAMEPRFRFINVMSMQANVDFFARSWRLGATMFTLFGALALLVAALGLYSVLAFDVAQRTRELGLRCALGARRGNLLGMVLARSLRMTGIGVLLGLAAAFLLAPRLRDLLYRTLPRDPLTLAAAALALLLVAVAAGVVPAWRAARVDPNVALRTD